MSYIGLPVTAEAAGSSPVVPANSFKHLQKWRHPGIGTKRHQIGTSLNAEKRRPCRAPDRCPRLSARSSASSLGGLASLLPNEKRHHGGLRSALFTRYGFGVGIQSDADR